MKITYLGSAGQLSGRFKNSFINADEIAVGPIAHCFDVPMIVYTDTPMNDVYRPNWASNEGFKLGKSIIICLSWVLKNFFGRLLITFTFDWIKNKFTKSKSNRTKKMKSLSWEDKKFL